MSTHPDIETHARCQADLSFCRATAHIDTQNYCLCCPAPQAPLAASRSDRKPAPPRRDVHGRHQPENLPVRKRDERRSRCIRAGATRHPGKPSTRTDRRVLHDCGNIRTPTRPIASTRVRSEDAGQHPQQRGPARTVHVRHRHTLPGPRWRRHRRVLEDWRTRDRPAQRQSDRSRSRTFADSPTTEGPDISGRPATSSVEHR